MSTSSSGGDGILDLIKHRGPQTAEAVARHLAISVPGARKHLAGLARAALVDHFDEAGSVGRPKRFWRLTADAERRFPDAHATLTVELIDSVRALFGADGLDRLIADRERQTLARYRAALVAVGGLRERVETLARLRSAEGYMAEYLPLGDGAFLLVENHCPICAAARACQGFCRSELAIFRDALGDDFAVERAEHMLDGSRRCAYRIAPRTEDRP